ncbi:MAG: beta-N-acetylhexosaminidase [Proteobacteria bacterium]|nr:beta-N-acetylhexosaminidase [Pseudomonadota bacterium]
MKPVIFACAGETLTAEEKAFFAAEQPAGIILFKRNVKNPEQASGLIRQIKSALGRSRVLILVDQEGGRVQRLGPPHWRRSLSARVYGNMAVEDADRAREALRLSILSTGLELRSLGITVDCLPVLDVPRAGSDEVIGDRAFSEDPAVVADLGRVAADALIEAGVLPIIKHIPGHGRAKVDSHQSLPRVAASLAELEANDFPPFRALTGLPMAITAHVVYEAIDPDNPATLSAKVIGDIIRGSIGFQGLLISDDLSMGALSGDLAARATGALAAGVDLALHCTGDMAEMQEIAAVLEPADDQITEKIGAALQLIADPPEHDAQGIIERYNDLMTAGV